MEVRVPVEPFGFSCNGSMKARDSALVIVDMQHDFCSPGDYWSAIGGDPTVHEAGAGELHAGGRRVCGGDADGGVRPRI